MSGSCFAPASAAASTERAELRARDVDAAEIRRQADHADQHDEQHDEHRQHLRRVVDVDLLQQPHGGPQFSFGIVVVAHMWKDFGHHELQPTSVEWS